MKSKILLLVLASIMVLTGICLAATPSKKVDINVQANIEAKASGLDVAISKIKANDCTGTKDTWTPSQTKIDFGTLKFHPTHKIFLPEDEIYYAVDVGVLDNSGTVWTVTHTRTDFKNASGTANLNENVNVSFVKVYKDSADKEHYTDLDKYSYADSNSKSYTKTALKEGSYQGWLRIYYGIGSGNTTTGCIHDNPGVKVIDFSKPGGNYSGKVTLTLTP